jgi:hypothetical protein
LAAAVNGDDDERRAAMLALVDDSEKHAASICLARVAASGRTAELAGRVTQQNSQHQKAGERESGRGRGEPVRGKQDGTLTRTAELRRDARMQL